MFHKKGDRILDRPLRRLFALVISDLKNPDRKGERIVGDPKPLTRVPNQKIIQKMHKKVEVGGVCA